ncbi:MAG: hypothetical protein EPN21_20280 [Methylococcaceae bacterium]|nr:MAG: hypothetical protein EPN21_20280 [Methylococcaceae bacterium]
MIKKILGNAALLLASVLLTFLALEWVVERYFITQTPLKFYFALSDGARILAQSSKRGRLPQDYLALAGDSFAQGKGDWLLEADPQRNSPFHSAHLLQQRTGQDVITFGKGAAGSVRGLVVEPIAKYEFLKEHVDEDFQPPQRILAYFYAGNDLTDNLKHLESRREAESLRLRESGFLPHHTRAELYDDAVMQAFLQEQLRERRGAGPFPALPSNRGWLLKAVYKVLSHQAQPVEDNEVAPAGAILTGSVSRALVNGKEVMLPDGLQAPGLELSESQVKDMVRVFQGSLGYLHRYFADSAMTAVYIPSTLEIYSIVSDQVSHVQRLPGTADLPTKRIATTSFLLQRSNALCRQVRAAALEAGVDFLDARAGLRSAARRGLIHGPRDWNHLNQAGYQALVGAILDQPDRDCTDIK